MVPDKPRLCTRIEGPLTSESIASTLAAVFFFSRLSKTTGSFMNIADVFSPTKTLLEQISFGEASRLSDSAIRKFLGSEGVNLTGPGGPARQGQAGHNAGGTQHKRHRLHISEQHLGATSFSVDSYALSRSSPENLSQ